MKNKNAIRLGIDEKILQVIAIVVSIVVFLLCVYPIYYCLIYSFSDGKAAQAQQIYFLPIKPTLDNYQMVFSEPMLLGSYLVTVLRTVIGTLTGVLFTAMVAYPLSRDYLKFRKTYSMIFIFTMYFSGGIIPQYLVYRDYGLLNHFSVYIIPSLLNVFNLLLCMSFFRDLPASLLDAAKIDGAGEYVILMKIVVPLSKPIIATTALFVGVYHWNDWFMSAYFTTSESLITLPTILMRLVSSADAQEKINQMILTSSGVTAGNGESGMTATAIRYATMLVSMLPIMMVYPFIQKYFDKGIMLGAIKA